MRPGRFRLIAAATLLVAWLGWLGYLAWSKTNPVVVSRSQVMVATHFVLAEVQVDPATGHPERDVRVVRDLRPRGEPIAGQVRVNNLKDARVAGGPDGFKAPGPYLLMLTKEGEQFVLTPIPKAPGHTNAPMLRPWAYRWDAPGVRDQFEALVPGPPPG